MTTQPLRIGFIGAGANTRLRHIPGFLELEGVQLAAVCNRSRASGVRVAAEFGIPRVETDPETIFADETIDAVCIGTWPYRHHDYSIQTLQAGKHVLCEARMAMDTAEARKMLATAQANPNCVAQLVPAPFDLASWRTIRKLIAEEAFGELHEVHATMLGNGAMDPSNPLHWRERSDYSGLNTLTLGILAETVQRWIGPTQHVVADAATFVRQRHNPESDTNHTIEIPDSLGVFARMANGARASYLLSSLTHSPTTSNGISLYGSAATLHWTQADDRMTLASLGEKPRHLAPDPDSVGSWNVEADFVTSIREGLPVELTSFEDGVRYMEFTEAVWQSWSKGHVVALEEV